MDRLDRGVDQGGAPAPADSLCWTEKVPPAGVVFFPARHPAHRGGVLTSGGDPVNILPLGPFQGIYRRSPDARYHLPVSQSGKSGDTKLDSVHLR